MKRSKWLSTSIGLLVVALMVVPLAAGCGSSGATITSGKLSMGSDTSYPPFESMEGTKPVGFDVELAAAIAKKMNLELEVISTAWDGIIPGLKTKKYDIIMSAMTITPERQKQISFSNPYINSDQSIAVVKGSPIKTQADLKDKVVGVQIDTTGQFKAEEIQKAGGLKEIQKFDTILVAFEALEQGKVDAIINDYPVSSYVSTKRGKTQVVAEIKTDEKYGIGIRKDNTDMLTNVNKALQEVKDDGSYATIYKKWFGTAPDTGTE
jgi:glutamine transport system substrate-binding protein